MENYRNMQTVHTELDAALAELEAAKVQKSSLCPPAESLNLDKPIPELSQDFLKAQENVRSLEDRVEVLTQELGWLMVDPRTRMAFKRMKGKRSTSPESR